MINVKACRESLGINKVKFAAIVGVSYSTTYSWERGDTKPSEENEVKIRKLMINKEEAIAEPNNTGYIITPKMSKKYGCKWCADCKNWRCPYKKCKYANILDSYKSYGDYFRKTTIDFFTEGGTR